MHWTADVAWQCIDLISDIHLCADSPNTFEAWKRHLTSTPAEAILMLGDVFEVWVGDDTRLNGFERECLQALQGVAKKKSLAFMAGNRDFLVGPDMLRDAGMIRLQDPTIAHAFGDRLLLSHGDALCLADEPYLAFRRQVRSLDWQTSFLAQALPARLAQARAMRQASAAHQASMAPDAWTDLDGPATTAWLDSAGCRVLVHGHTHRPAHHALPGGRSRRVLGDWQFDSLPHRARILRWTAQGLTELDLAVP